MRINAIAVTFALCALLILISATCNVHAQNFVQYKVQVNSDGSANWTIIQASNSNGTVESWQGFQQQIINLINTARNQTQREMSLDNNSLQMNTIWENQSETTEYEFTWLNFSIIQGDRLTFGDVFQVKDFFGQLFGDGEIQVVYPASYQLVSVSPQPNGGNTNPQTLDWLGTQFFVNGNPSITIEPSSEPSSTPSQESNAFGWQFYVLIGSGVAAALAAFSVASFIVKRRMTKAERINASTPMPPIESEEEKILKIIRASGGSTYQSDITEKCNFSKAKTSQLLTTLEKKGIISRYKKGRDKIVNLTELSKMKHE